MEYDYKQVAPTVIPKIFQSFVDEKPFDTCITCEKYLLDEGTEYIIEKSITEHDVIFDYAICIDCAARMRETMSVQSLETVDRYFMQHLDFSQRLLYTDDDPNVDDWLESCILKGTARDDIHDYQIYAHCNGPNLKASERPYMISGIAIEEISELISAQTRDEIDDFIDEHFGIPPELKQIIKDKEIVLI
ncbi:MAG: hypothetical protein IIA45_13705 [Bacteroidetes bacterium]|nr:hypothetical protein [Bacteroidota bacterium]